MNPVIFYRIGMPVQKQSLMCLPKFKISNYFKKLTPDLAQNRINFAIRKAASPDFSKITFTPQMLANVDAAFDFTKE